MADIVETIFKCDLEKLKILLQNGKKVNNEIPGTEGCTPLHLIVGIENATGKDAVLSYLLEAKADPNARSYDDLTPVHIASMWNNYLELEKLLLHGGNPWLTDNENKNAFDLAADNNAYEAFQLLNKFLADGKLNFRKFPKPQEKHLEHVDCFDLEKSLCDTLVKSAYITANENPPFYFSSTDDESTDCFLNVSRILKKTFNKCRSPQKKGQKNLSSNVSDKLPLNKKMFTLSRNAETDSCSEDLFNKRVETDHDTSLIFSSDETELYDLTESEDCMTEDSDTILYSDESGIMLLEKCINSNCRSVKSFLSNSSDSSTNSDWKSCRSEVSYLSGVSSCESHSTIIFEIPKELLKLSNTQLFQELKNLGDNPGPISDATRNIYIRRLARIKIGCNNTCDLPKPKYCREVYMFLNNKLDSDRIQNLLNTMTENFNSPNPNEKWREGNQRCCFNYFLLDPRVTQNLPSRLKQFTFESAFLTFIDALFYVGKGTRGRPYSHLIEAAKAVNNNPKDNNDKINHILNIWKSGLGVVSLHCFNNSVPVEAYTQEACIIEAVGLENLTNKKSGDYYGPATQWKRSWKRQAGVALLHRALQIFIIEGEKQILLKDVKR